MPRRRGTALLAATLALAALGVAGCGRDDHENDPRPPVPAEVSVEIGQEEVVVSPSEFGAGPTNFTIANLGDRDAVLAIDGPTVAQSDEVPPGGTGVLKTELVSGDYRASAEGGDAAPFNFQVGAERPSAKDELLLP
jgi:hypothetical protein